MSLLGRVVDQLMRCGSPQLLSTAEDVSKMQEDLENMGPLLEEAARDTEVTMQQIKVGGRQIPPDSLS